MSDVIGRIEVFFDETKTESLVKNLGREIVARQVEALRDDIRLTLRALQVSNERRKTFVFLTATEFSSDKEKARLRDVVNKTNEAMKDCFPDEKETLAAMRTKYQERIL